MSVLGGLILRKKLQVQQRDSIYSGTIYGDFKRHSEFEVQNFEVFLRVKADSLVGNRRMLSVGFTAAGGSRGGHMVIHRDGQGSELLITDSGSTVTNNNTNIIMDTTSYHDITFRKYGTTLDWKLDGSSGTFILSTANVEYSNIVPLTETFFGALRDGSHAIQDTLTWQGKLNELRYYELGVTGNRIKKLIEVDNNNGDANTIPNIANSKPLASDMNWVPSGSGLYV